MNRWGHSWAIAGLLTVGVLSAATPAHAIVITPTSNTGAIIAALTAGNTGLNVVNLTVNGNTAGAAQSTGTYTNASGTYGIGSGVVMSSGNVSDYADGPNTVGNRTTSYGTTPNATQNALLTQVSGVASYFDATSITVDFTLDAGFNSVFFNVVFGSEEFPEFVGSTFIDAFGLFVNGVNVAFSGGLPINVNHPAFTAMGGTQLDGVIAPGGNPVLTFGTLLANPQGLNTLTFIIADRGDSILDSTAFISALGAENPAPPSVPEPASLVLLGSGLIGLVVRRARRG
jgi:hypothetical protein